MNAALVIARPGLGSRRARPHLSSTDRNVLGLWCLAHISLLVFAYAAAWVLQAGTAHAPLTGGFEHWDAVLLQSVARYGYFGGADGTVAHPNQVAFFPGYPLVLAAVHLVVRDWIASELLVSFAAGAVAMLALGRIAENGRAAVYLLAAPAAVFLMVGYSEPLFLAFALPAWLAARRGAWWRAGALGFLAAATRPDGLFLLAALGVMALAGPRGQRLRSLLRLGPAALAPAAYELYLRVTTGRWNAWMLAQQAGWDLHPVTPLQAYKTTWWAAFRHPFSAEYAFMSQLEIWAMLAGLALTAVLLAKRMWPEAVYVGLTFTALATETWYQTVPRSLLVAFPLYVLLARTRHRWLGPLYLAVSAPLAAVLALMYLGGQWAG